MLHCACSASLMLEISLCFLCSNQAAVFNITCMSVTLAELAAADPVHECPFCAMCSFGGSGIPAHSPSGEGSARRLHAVFMDATVQLGRHFRKHAKVLSAVDHDGCIQLYAAGANKAVLDWTNKLLPTEFQELLTNASTWLGGCSAHATCARRARAPVVVSVTA